MNKVKIEKRCEKAESGPPTDIVLSPYSSALQPNPTE